MWEERRKHFTHALVDIVLYRAMTPPIDLRTKVTKDGLAWRIFDEELIAGSDT